MHEHVRKRRDLLAVFEQLRQIIGDALRVDRVHFCHFHGNLVGRQRRRVREYDSHRWRSVGGCDPLDAPDGIEFGGVYSFDMSIVVRRYLKTFFAF